VTGVLLADDLDVDSLAGGGEENTLDEVHVHPRLKLTHPESRLGLLRAARRRGHSRHVGGRRGSVRERHFGCVELESRLKTLLKLRVRLKRFLPKEVVDGSSERRDLQTQRVDRNEKPLTTMLSLYSLFDAVEAPKRMLSGRIETGIGNESRKAGIQT
jgi:hypothetical protein